MAGHGRRIRDSGLLPGVNALLLATLGVAINFATDLKTSWIAWVAVVAVALGAAVVTMRLDHRGRGGDGEGGRIVIRSPEGDLEKTSGLTARATEFERVDGSKVRIVEFFKDEVAIETFRQYFERGDS